MQLVVVVPWEGEEEPDLLLLLLLWLAGDVVVVVVVVVVVALTTAEEDEEESPVELDLKKRKISGVEYYVKSHQMTHDFFSSKLIYSHLRRESLFSARRLAGTGLGEDLR